jgi:hypothetical protein
MADYNKAGGISVSVASADEVLTAGSEEFVDGEDENRETIYDPLVSYIISKFHENRRARETSRIEDEILEGLEAYNGKYSTKDLARIRKSRGSEIFMNITATKARAARSWIADILKPAKGTPWSLEPTPLEDLPGDLKKLLTEAFEKEFAEMIKPPAPPAQGQPQLQQGQPQAPQPQAAPTMEQAQATIREINQKKRDVEKAVAEEITREAQYQLGRMERKIRDQLAEGNWDKALSDFLTDFVVYPAAFMKGPIVSKKKKLVWRDGKAVIEDVYQYLNKRVDPFDIYPSPEAECIHDGNLCEHMRMSGGELETFKGVPGYHDKAIDQVIAEADQGLRSEWMDISVEDDKAEVEDRGDFMDVTRNTIHGLHFWGNIKVSELKEWEFKDKIKDLEKQKDNDIVSIEAILVGNHVIKCVLNDDPLKRRPYYKASFMDNPGAFWGKSLPYLMRSIQRMCNAVARALSNNLGIASGPQIELYTDRLADNGDIEEIIPFKIWQLRSDPSGAGGRAINFWQPTSNASELLGVYEKFEEKADDVTGIPKYAYGNEKSGGASQTAQGLAMLLETTSKIIKDCIRNIDEGLIKPRVMFQFHHNMLYLENFGYSGDINVCTVGSDTLTIRGAEATKRNEFLQATANPTDMAVMGVEGRAKILTKMADDLNIPGFMPSEFEIQQKLKKQEEQAQAQAQAAAQAEQEKATVGLKATQMQVEGQMQMHQGTLQKDMAKIQTDMQKFMKNFELQMAELQRKMAKDQQDGQVSAIQEQGKSQRQTQEIGLKLKTGKEGI